MNATETDDARRIALALHLTGCKPAWRTGVEVLPEGLDEIDEDWGIWKAEGAEWLVLTDDEADERARADIADCLWAFNAWFLAGYLPDGIGPDEIDKLRGDRCEDCNDAVRALVDAGGPDNFERLASDAIGCDGRGHFLNTYDGEEHEIEVDGELYYVYRVN